MDERTRKLPPRVKRAKKIKKLAWKRGEEENRKAFPLQRMTSDYEGGGRKGGCVKRQGIPNENQTGMREGEFKEKESWKTV